MKQRVISITFAALALALAAVAAEDLPKCSANAQECELEIRQMLSGRRYLGIQIVDTNPGILIKAVNNDGPAAHVDLEAGDRIVAVNGRPMTASGVRDFKAVLAESKDNGGLLFMIVKRRSLFRKVEVRLQPYPKTQVDKIVAAHLAQSHPGANGSQ
jgi:predicted metalloprotease with PDZ domain